MAAQPEARHVGRICVVAFAPLTELAVVLQNKNKQVLSPSYTDMQPRLLQQSHSWE
jgi:hypothetical protein